MSLTGANISLIIGDVSANIRRKFEFFEAAKTLLLKIRCGSSFVQFDVPLLVEIGCFTDLIDLICVLVTKLVSQRELKPSSFSTSELNSRDLLSFNSGKISNLD